MIVENVKKKKLIMISVEIVLEKIKKSQIFT